MPFLTQRSICHPDKFKKKNNKLPSLASKTTDKIKRVALESVYRQKPCKLHNYRASETEPWSELDPLHITHLSIHSNEKRTGDSHHRILKVFHVLFLIVHKSCCFCLFTAVREGLPLQMSVPWLCHSPVPTFDLPPFFPDVFDSFRVSPCFYSFFHFLVRFVSGFLSGKAEVD